MHDNPETITDPTGHDGFFGAVMNAVSSAAQVTVHAVAAAAPVVAQAAWTAVDAATGISSMIGDVQTLTNPNTSFLDKALAVGDLALNVAMDASMVVDVGEGVRAGYLAAKVGAKVAEEVGAHVLEGGAEQAT